MRLIYLSPVPRASFSQRPHKFVEWFHQRSSAEVIWVDPYPTRFPRWRDLQHRQSGAQSLPSTATSVPAWLKVVGVSALPIEPLPFSGWLNGLLWRRLIARLRTFAAKGTSIIAIGKPSALALAVVERLTASRSIYDAMDDFPSFYSGLSRLAMRRREARLVQRVDAVLVSSSELRKRWSGARPDVQLVHNGLDVSVLPAARSRHRGERPVFGYVGTIGAWFDWQWLSALAKARSADIVRLIGPQFVTPPEGLPRNIEILPPCTHAAALSAMRDFDAGLIPFKVNELTASIDPIKYYEYRALGLPVVSTDFGEMGLRTKAGGTFISRTADDIPQVVAAALLFRDDAATTRQFAAGNSWEARFDAASIFP